MENTQESSADVVAEMRTKAECAFPYDDGIVMMLTVLADRLEAALKREHEASGNAAALREALEHVEKLAREFAAGNYYVSDFPKMLLDAIQPALAKPPRNCDRFGGDIDKLREACARERGLNPEEDFPDVFPDWLLAPSTAKERGAK